MIIWNNRNAKISGKKATESESTLMSIKPCKRIQRWHPKKKRDIISKKLKTGSTKTLSHCYSYDDGFLDNTLKSVVYYLKREHTV